MRIWKSLKLMSLKCIINTVNSAKRQENQAIIFVNYKKGCTHLAAASDKVYQLLAHGRWFSPDTPASSTTKTGRHDITEILLKVALSTKIRSISPRGTSYEKAVLKLFSFYSLNWDYVST